ncbi:hypothetical protein ABT300_01480 [Streptomyces sp. NPDC001027]|uniref:hypothetical protein n=1 Tax=Streptomyces sp. NPDC001027 TaxID=3154771 RepID=UPI003320CE0A
MWTGHAANCPPAGSSRSAEPQPGPRASRNARNADGTDGPVLAPLTLRPGGRLPIGDLTRSIAATLGVESLGSGDFARQTIETAERVTFLSA